MELLFDVSDLERACCQTLQGRGSRTVGAAADSNPITLRDVGHFTSKWSSVHAPAALVYRYMDSEVLKNHSSYLRGPKPFGVVTVNQRGGLKFGSRSR